MGSRTSLSAGPLFLGSLLFTFAIGGFKPSLHSKQYSLRSTKNARANPKISLKCLAYQGQYQVETSTVQTSKQHICRRYLIPITASDEVFHKRRLEILLLWVLLHNINSHCCCDICLPLVLEFRFMLVRILNSLDRISSSGSCRWAFRTRWNMLWGNRNVENSVWTR